MNGGVITAFVGGLPRAQHADKHTISVLGGPEEHICFQFGSAVRDFVILPKQEVPPKCDDKKEEKAAEENGVAGRLIFCVLWGVGYATFK